MEETHPILPAVVWGLLVVSGPFVVEAEDTLTVVIAAVMPSGSSGNTED